MGYAFISYSSKQQQDADRLRLLLHANKIDTWMAPYDIPDGSEYADMINNVIQNAACLVLLLTDDAQNSIYVDKEIERALHYGKTIAPIQLDHATLNDSFSFYLCNQQIVMVSAIDESVPQMQKLLQHLQFLCNEQLPSKETDWDASRDKRVRRQRTARFFSWLGIVILCISLFCGYQYVAMASRVTFIEMYGMEDIPGLPEIARTYCILFFLAFAAVTIYLYGYGLRDPRKKTWNPIRVLPTGLFLPAFSVLCGAGYALVYFARQSVEEIVRHLEIYREPTEGYILPQWVMPVAWIFAILCVAAALLSLVFAFLHGGFPKITARRKRGGK